MKMPTTDRRFGMTTAIEDIRQHMDNNNDWTFEYLFCTYLDLLHVGDDDFIYFLEQYTHPVIQRFNITEDLERIEFGNECVDAINKYLVSDGYKLLPSTNIADKVIYSVVSLNLGVQGSIKNIIFASKYKPEIVLEDALNNDIKIVSNQDKCLVYDKPVLKSGISWNELKDWYDEKLFVLDTGKELKDRLGDSLASPPEVLFYYSFTYGLVMQFFTSESVYVISCQSHFSLSRDHFCISVNRSIMLCISLNIISIMLNTVNFNNNSFMFRNNHQKIHSLMLKYLLYSMLFQFRIIIQIYLWQQSWKFTFELLCNFNVC